MLVTEYVATNVEKVSIETDAVTRDRTSPPLPSSQLPPGFESQYDKAPEKNIIDLYANVPIVQDPKNPKIWKAE